MIASTQADVVIGSESWLDSSVSSSESSHTTSSHISAIDKMMPMVVAYSSLCPTNTQVMSQQK
ncbi:hypothetical protein DPMN_102924 [Dreissena polymorpha]|uniref:Uncharacterized protein n=1 Tax=Dreissena polymorpha TaxID=45954 RepID=A0A9D4H525_DREPO|nr:hypothetical protein DPMN_102924 [Dreissena polymorpha]